MSNWPEKVYGQVSITGDKYIAAWKLNDNRLAIEYIRSDLALPGDLKAELLSFVEFVGAELVELNPENYTHDDMCRANSSVIAVLTEYNKIRAAIERLNGVKS